MIVALPHTTGEWLTWIAPLAAIATGIVYFALPRQTMRHLGFVATDRHRQLNAVGRASMAGFPVGLGLCAILFAQPVLFTAVGLGFAVTAAGQALHVMIDGGNRWSLFVRLAVAASLALLSLVLADVPDFAFAAPAGAGEAIVMLVAAFTGVAGLVGFLAPRHMMVSLQLADDAGRSDAYGEFRGVYSGFRIAAGFCALAFGGPFAALALGCGWLASAFGCLIAILFDGCNTRFYWSTSLITVVLGLTAVLAAVGIIG
jgi:hypothetical protein